MHPYRLTARNRESDPYRTALGTPTVCSGCRHDYTALPNVDAVSCNLEACEIRSCNGGWDDGDNAAGHRCETELRTVADCGVAERFLLVARRLYQRDRYAE